MSILVEKVSKKYGDQIALDKVSFQVGSGEIVGFIGPNGAGKSTMMKIITGYIKPLYGTVKVAGIDISKNPIGSRERIGYLPENNPLYTEMYIKEYLEFVASVYKVKNKKQRVEQLIEMTGLQPEKNKRIGALSKGYRQRVGLAQALVHDPDVLILDEPTSGLDPNQIIEIRNLISEVGKKKTIMLSTHLMQEVEAICQRAIILKKGQIVADDSTSKLTSKVLDKKQTVVVEFNQGVREEQLMKIQGVSGTAKINDQNWIVQGDASEDTREHIFSFAVENNLKVLSMQQKEKSLEEVFQELTK